MRGGEDEGREEVKRVCVCVCVRTLFIGMVDIQQGDVIAINMSKPHLGLICFLLLLSRPDKHLRNWRIGTGNSNTLTSYIL